MKNKYSVLLILGCVLLGMSSCEWKVKNDNVVDLKRGPIVTVYNKTLYLDDVEMAVPHYLNSADSAAMADHYIEIWTKNQLLYNKAKQNVVNTNTIDELVEEYRKSLVVNSYRERVLEEHFSKLVTGKTLEDYYNDNLELFNMEEPIIKGLFLKIPINSPQVSNFRKWYTQRNEDALSNIENNTLQHTVIYDYFYDRWVKWPEVLANIPFVVKDANQFLKTNKYIDVKDSTYVYLLDIKAYKLAGEPAPFEYVKPELANIYKERNRAVYMERIQADLLKKALSDKQVTYYKEENNN